MVLRSRVRTCASDKRRSWIDALADLPKSIRHPFLGVGHQLKHLYVFYSDVLIPCHELSSSQPDLVRLLDPDHTRETQVAT